MASIPNPWIPESEADNSHALDAGAAPDLGRSSAAPVPIEACDSLLAEGSSDLQVGLTGAPTQERPVADLDATDDIAELLRCAFMPADPDYSTRFPRGFDPHIFMDTLEAIVEAIDPIPLFLRRTG